MLKSFTKILFHLFNEEPKMELLAFKGTMFPLNSILVTLISRIYALLHSLNAEPNLELLAFKGTMFPLSSIFVTLISLI